MITKEFVLAGKATFTVEVPATFVEARRLLGDVYHPHYTYRVERVEMADRADPKKSNEYYFVKTLRGPDNTDDYVYVGVLHPGLGTVRLTAKSAFPADATRVTVLNRVLTRVFAGEGDVITAAGWDVHHEGHCGRCGRLLTVPESIKSGIGPECAKKMGCGKPKAAPAF